MLQKVNAAKGATPVLRRARAPFTRQFYRGNRLNFTISVVCVILCAAVELFIARILQSVLDVAVSGSMEGLGSTLISMLIFFVSSVALDLLLRRYRNRYIARAMTQYKQYAFEQLSRKSIRTFSREGTSSYISALTNDAAAIERNYVTGALQLLNYCLWFVGSLAMMFWYNWSMTLVVLALSALPVIVSLSFGGKRAAQEKAVSDRNEGFVSMVKDLLSGFSVIKSFKAEKEVAGLFDKENAGLENTSSIRRRTADLINIISGYAGALVQFGVFVYGAVLAVRGDITPGVVVAFVQLMNYVLQPVRAVPELITQRWAALALIDKLAAALGQNAELKGTARPKNLSDGIRYRDVTFAYEQGGENVLKGVDIAFEQGRSYAVVGASGSGKSTLLSLLLGAYDQYGGSVTLGGAELRDIDPEALYDIVSIIQQNVFVFDSSIADNITLFKEFPKEKVDSAIQRAGLGALVAEKGGAYRCGENGSALSGGEKQRVSIARCLLRDTPVLLMDEATAALDAVTSHAVTDAILNIRGLTRIVVTHKLDESLMKRFDRIIALRGGRVAEAGSYDELLAQKGYFYSLCSLADA